MLAYFVKHRTYQKTTPSGGFPHLLNLYITLPYLSLKSLNTRHVALLVMVSLFGAVHVSTTPTVILSSYVIDVLCSQCIQH